MLLNDRSKNSWREQSEIRRKVTNAPSKEIKSMSLTRIITGLSWHIDNHVVDLPVAEDLRKLYREGWIYLQTADTVMVEQLEAQDEVTRERLIGQRNVYPMPLGPTVLGSSLLDYSVNGSDEDDVRIAKVHETLWPTRNLEKDRREAENNRMARSCFRDTLIVSTAIHYVAAALITNDGGILEARGRLSQEFNGFCVMSINEATLRAFVAVRQLRKIAILRPDNPRFQNLPSWPPEPL